MLERYHQLRNVVQRRSCSRRFAALRTPPPGQRQRHFRSPVGGPFTSTPVRLLKPTDRTPFRLLSFFVIMTSFANLQLLTLALWLFCVESTSNSPVRICLQDTRLSLRGEEVKTITLANSQISVTISTLGAAITSLYAPDINGEYRDVVLGFQDHGIQAQLSGSPNFGCVVGRVDDQFSARKNQNVLNNTEHLSLGSIKLNGIHGQHSCFSKRVWSITQLLSDGIQLGLQSPSGDQVFRIHHKRACTCLLA